MARFVVHSAREELGRRSDIWLVIDTIDGTAVSQNSTREDAERDWALLTGFYNQRPGQHLDQETIPLEPHPYSGPATEKVAPSATTPNGPVTRFFGAKPDSPYPVRTATLRRGSSPAQRRALSASRGDYCIGSLKSFEARLSVAGRQISGM